MSWLKKRLPKKRWKRVLLYLFSTFLILLAADMILVQYWRRIEIGPDTTRITGPLTAAGYPDYFAALNTELSRGVTSGNNAAPFLISLLPKGIKPPTDQWTSPGLPTEKWRKDVLDYLGQPEPSVDSALVNYGEWLTRKGITDEQEHSRREDEIVIMQHNPWRAAEHPEWKQWVDANAAALALLEQAVKRDRYYVPLLGPNGKTSGSHPGNIITVILPSLGTYRGASQLLLTRAMLRLGEGDTAGFLQDVVATLKLARLVAQGGTIIEHLVAVAIEGSAHQAIQQAATGDALDRASAQRLAALLTSLPPLTSLAHSLDFAERFMFLDSVCMIAERGPDGIREISPEPADRRPISAAIEKYLIPINCNGTMRTGNLYYDRFVGALAEPIYQRQKAQFDAIEHDIFAFRSQNIVKQIDDPGMLLVSILLTPITHISQNCLVVSVSSDLSALTLQLRLYKIDHGEYPDALAALPASATTDRFTDAPLIYHRTASGYALYSVGPNGKDDGGISRKEAKGKPDWDIVVKTEK